MNVIAAVFVEVAVSRAKGDNMIQLMEDRKHQQEVSQQLIKVFQSADSARRGRVTCDEWVDFVGSAAGKEFMTMFSQDSKQAEKIFRMLDLDESGAIEIEEFVVGFMRILGSPNKAKQYELETALHSQKSLLRKVYSHIIRQTEEIRGSLEKERRMLAGKLDVLVTRQNQQIVPKKESTDLSESSRVR